MSKTHIFFRSLIMISLVVMVIGFYDSPTFAAESSRYGEASGSNAGTVELSEFFTEKPAQVQLVKVTSRDSDAFAAEWMTNKQCDGYELQYSRSKYFFTPLKKAGHFYSGGITIRNSKRNHTKVIGLRKGTTYFVRIRSYTVERKEKKYSDWSYVKTVELPLSVIATNSDYQSMAGKSSPSENLTKVLSRVYRENYDVDNMIVCGDYTRQQGSYGHKADHLISQIKEIAEKQDPTIHTENFIFVQGNHDQWSDSLTKGGMYYFSDYIVYVMNTESANPNHQGVEHKKKMVKEAAAKLSAAMNGLIQAGETRPVIIATHVPLHYSRRTAGKFEDNIYSGYLFEALNQAGKKLNIIYLFGHNHSKDYDNYLGASCVYRPVGSKILIPDEKDSGKFQVKKLKFTYMNAGYVGYMADSALDNTMSCGLISIYKDKILITRCSEKGIVQLGNHGVHSYNAVPARYNVNKVESPQIIRR